jgi:hypothetical protein
VYKDVLPKGKPNPNIIKLPTELLENLTTPPKELKSIYRLIAKLEPIHATMLLQSTLLNMSLRDIATYHQDLYSKNTCNRKITTAAAVVARLALRQ